APSRRSALWKPTNPAAPVTRIFMPASSPGSVRTEQVAAVHFANDVADVVGHTVGDDDVCLLLELLEVVNDTGVEELAFLEHRLVDNDLDALRLDALHDALDAGGAEIIRTSFHDQAVDANHLRAASQDVRGNEVLAGGIGVDDCPDQVLGNVVVVGKQLLGVLG